MAFFFVGCADSGLQVAQIVHTVKNTDDVDSVCNGFLYEILYYVVCVRTISQDILSAEQHLQFCIFESVTEFSQSHPWIFMQKT